MAKKKEEKPKDGQVTKTKTEILEKVNAKGDTMNNRYGSIETEREQNLAKNGVWFMSESTLSDYTLDEVIERGII